MLEQPNSHLGLHKIQICNALDFLSNNCGSAWGRAWVIAKKMFSVSLVFNALLTIACCMSILGGFYWFNLGWKPFAPYLIDGNIFWFAIAAAVINIYPSAMVGRKLHTGRFLFHHYLYGLIVIACAVLYIFFFTPESLLTIFFRKQYFD